MAELQVTPKMQKDFETLIGNSGIADVNEKVGLIIRVFFASEEFAELDHSQREGFTHVLFDLLRLFPSAVM